MARPVKPRIAAPHPWWALAGSALLLGACSSNSPRHLPGDNEPTLRALRGRSVPVDNTQRLASDEDRALRAWRELLAAQPTAPQRAQALRRLGDLEMDRSDARLAGPDSDAANATTAAGAPDYKAAIKGYQDYLKAYPDDPDNDRVLYQLARAHEQGGDLDTALAVLDRLVARYPDTAVRDEAQFRRGELLFTARRYPAAEQAYARVLASPDANPYRDRALYMQGWAQFKQARLEPALASFLGVLDGKLAHTNNALPLDALPGLSRGDRELVEDSFRVVSLALENLQGAASIPPLMTNPARQSYEVRLHQQLAALYLKQDRPKDAADTCLAFVKRHPLDAQAPAMQSQVIEIFGAAGFEQLALQAKQAFVEQYAAQGEFAKANPAAWQQARPLVRTHLNELARHYHAAAQRQHLPADVAMAVRWYRESLQAFPDEADAAQRQFLLAELLLDHQRPAEAAEAFERSAYGYPAHARSADAGYSALLALARQERDAGTDARPALRRQGVSSALRFAAAFPADARTAPVLANAADTLYQLGDSTQAQAVATQVLALQPAAPAEQRRVALNVLSHTAFAAGEFAQAEQHTRAVLGLTPDNATGRNAVSDRLAAALYKQAEQARDAGRQREAAALFAKVAQDAPQSPVRVAAQFDAAAQWLALKDWAAATALLEDFRTRFPADPLQAQVPARLALAYTEQGRWAAAAAEVEKLATAERDAAKARELWWQAAELLDKAQAAPGQAPSATVASRKQAASAWERVLRQGPQRLAVATEARARLALFARQDGASARELAWQRELFETEAAGGEARTARTRLLGAQAALALAAPQFESYRKVALVEPLQKSLKTKRTQMDATLKAYAVAADSGVAEVVTSATFHTAALYQDFGRALLDSQRPKKLSKLELEQYNVLLEEQAFPFEEKAIELHELNADQSTRGVYDEWVQRSFTALRTLRPARWGKEERTDASGSALAALNAQAIAQRQQGEFAQARATWEKALAQDPAYATALLNLGVLLDLYLGDAPAAQARFEAYLALQPGGDPQVAKWLTDVKNRRPTKKEPS